MSSQYMHKGFLLYDLMTPLMPNLAKGNNVYRLSQGTYGAASASLQQLPLPGSNPNDDSANPIDETVDPVDETADPVDDADGTPPPPSSEASLTRVSPPSLLASTTASSTNF